MNKFIICVAASVCSIFGAHAETVLLNETFNDGDYNKSFPYVIDGDGYVINDIIRSLFVASATGTPQPWWVVRDTNQSTDMGFASHSWYEEPAQSDDWIVSVPLEISSTGFVLEFDAQSLTLTEQSDRLSDLSLYITEELVDPYNLPINPTEIFEEVPRGAKFDEIENDYTHYTYSLDPWAGKTIYINFANQNYDKEILVLDNIKVARADRAELAVEPVGLFTSEAEVAVNATVNVTSADGVKGMKLTLEADGSKVGEFNAERLEAGEHPYAFVLPLTADHTTSFTVTLTAEGNQPLQFSGEVTRLLFAPDRRVLVEETTGTWCGNCPLGIYTMEQIHADQELSQKVIPVSVHIPGSGADRMVVKDYAYQTTNAAPMALINRRGSFAGFSGLDAEYDPTVSGSTAFNIARAASELAPLGIDVQASYVFEGTDTVSIQATATVSPALSSKGSRYRVGFILTENNVGYDKSADGSKNLFWTQANYMTDLPYDSHLGGWTELPKVVTGVRFQDVARAIYGYDGIEGSFPAEMTAGETYTFSQRLDIPQIPTTETMNTGGNTVTYGCSNPIAARMCEVVAFVIDTTTGEIANAAVTPMSPEATQRFTTRMLVEKLNSGIEEITMDSTEASSGENEAQYFDLYGRRVLSPLPGQLLISRRGSTASKIIF